MGRGKNQRLAAGCESAQVRVGDPEVFVGIDRDIVDPDLVVKMRTGAASAVSHVTDCVATVYVLSRVAGEALQVTEASRDPVAVV